jgi:hypothetical protein
MTDARQFSALRARPVLSLLALLAAFLSPLVIIALVSRALLPQGLMEGVAVPEAMRSETPNVVAGLIRDMLGMGIGMMVAAWLIFRQEVAGSAKVRHAVFFLGTFVCAFVSIFSGLRGEYALAFIISTQPFDLQKISPFIEMQAIFLALTLMCIFTELVNFVIFSEAKADRRGE